MAEETGTAHPLSQGFIGSRITSCGLTVLVFLVGAAAGLTGLIYVGRLVVMHAI